MSKSISVAVILFLGFIAGAYSQTSCTQGLLKRSEIIDRFGGNSNILAAPATAASTLPICQALAGQQVCVNSAGFANFQMWIQAYKPALTNRGLASKVSTVGNASTIAQTLNVQQCIDTVTYTSVFQQFSMNAQQGQAQNQGVQIDYSPLMNNLSNIITQIKSQAEYTGQVSRLTNVTGNWKAYETDVAKQKATCETALVQHIISVTCLAANASSATLTSGTDAGSATVNYAQGACDYFKQNCLTYFIEAKRLVQASQLIQTCTNSLFTSIYQALIAGNSSGSNQQLNQLWQQLAGGARQQNQQQQQIQQQNGGAANGNGIGNNPNLGQRGQQGQGRSPGQNGQGLGNNGFRPGGPVRLLQGQNGGQQSNGQQGLFKPPPAPATNPPPFGQLDCDFDNLNAPDCNFVCNQCINATHIYENAFLSLNSSAGRNLQSSTGLNFVSGGQAGLAPQTYTADMQANAGVTPEQTTLSAAKLALYIFGALALALGAILA